jgi:hypothetical protein
MIFIPFSIEKMYIRPLVQCHLPPVWPPVLPLNLTYILKFLPLLPWAINLGRLSKECVQVRGFLFTFVTGLFLRSGAVRPTSNPQAGGLLLVGCPPLLIQYISRYPAYLEAVSSISNLSTRHAAVNRVTWIRNRKTYNIIYKIKLILYKIQLTNLY